MTTTITATIGMTAGTVTPDMFIDRLISAGRDGDDELTSATRWTVRPGVSNSHLSIEKIVDGRPAERHSMCRTIFIAAVQEWAEQALRHIEDTPDHWLRNALAVTAGSWGSVDVDADDWLSLVTCYIAENHGDQDGE